MSSGPSESMDQSHLLQNQLYLNTNSGNPQRPLPSNSYGGHGFETQHTQRMPCNNITSGPHIPMTMPGDENILRYPIEANKYCGSQNQLMPTYNQNAARSAATGVILEYTGDRIIDTSKRFRTVFTDAQKKILKSEFAENMFLNQERRRNIAAMLQLSEKTVKVWFQNRRMDIQRQKKLEFSNSSTDSETMSPASSTFPYEDGTFYSNPGYQIPHDFDQAIIGHPYMSNFDVSLHPDSACYLAEAHSHTLLPCNNMNEFDTSPDSLSNYFVSNQTGIKTNDIIEAASYPLENQEDAYETSFRIMQYMN